MTVEDRRGRRASGWGETPLAVQWGWPAPISYDERHDVMTYLCHALGDWLVSRGFVGHPIEIGHDFLQPLLQDQTQRFNVQQGKDGQPTAIPKCPSSRG